MSTVFPFTQLELSTPALLALVRANLSLAPKVIPKPFSAKGTQYQIESITILENSSLRTTRMFPWAYEYDTYLGQTLNGPPLDVPFVDVLQRVRVSLSRVVVTAGETTFEDAGEMEGNAVVVLRCSPDNLAGALSMGVESFEPDSLPPSDFRQDPEFRLSLRFAVGGALVKSAISTSLPTFMTRRDSGGQLTGPKVGHAGIAASSDGARVAIRLQIGRSVDHSQFNEWVRFHSGDFPDTMTVPGGTPNHWAVVLSAPLVEGMVSTNIWDAMREHEDQVRLQGGVSVIWSPENGEAKVSANWYAELIDACIGLGNIDMEMWAAVRFSVPGPNLLQTQSDVSWEFNKWQLYGCALAAGAIGFLTGGTLGSGIGGAVGNRIGSTIGGIGSFFGALLFADNFVPDMAPASCSQSGSTVICDRALDTQVPLGVNPDGTQRTMQLTPNRVGGHVDGLFLSGLLTGIPIPMSTRAIITGKNFAWAAPGTDCGVSGALKLVMAAHMRDLVTPVARVTITQDASPNQAKLELYSVQRVSADPHHVFPDSGIQIRPIGNWIEVSIAATPNFNYYSKPYSLSVRVATNGGTRIVNLGKVPMLTDEIVDQLKGDMAGSISNCYSMIDEFTRKFGKMNPKWIPDPPPDEYVAKTRRLWLLEVHGLEPNEVLSVVADPQTFTVQANRQGVAQIRAITGPGEFSLQRLSVNGHTAANGDLPEGVAPLSYVSRQVELTEQAVLSFPQAAEALDLGRTEGAPLLSVLLNGEVHAYDLQQPASPRLVYRGHAPQATGVLSGADGVYIAAAGGLTRWTHSDRTPTRLSDQPVVALVREQSFVSATLADGRRLAVHPGALPEEVSRVSSPVATNRQWWNNLVLGRKHYIAPDNEDRYALFDHTTGDGEALETYSELPWFAQTLTLGSLVVVQSRDRQAHTLTIYSIGSTAGSFPPKAAELAAQINPERLSADRQDIMA